MEDGDYVLEREQNRDDEFSTIVHNTSLRVPNGIESVSYTHLDVYKRQVIHILHEWKFGKK